MVGVKGRATNGDTWEVANFEVMKKRKLLLLNGCECKKPISTTMGFLKSWEDKSNVATCSGNMLKHNDTSLD